MSLSIEIQKKPKGIQEKNIINKASQIYELQEVQEIKDAIQEHLLFVGLNMKNHVRNIRLIGVGHSHGISVDSKEIIRTALLTASDRVILVHNHPSNGLSPSKEDLYISNITNKLLKVFNIEFLDHIIVTENDYLSMAENNTIDRDYENIEMNFMEKNFLIEENEKLKEQIEVLACKLKSNETSLYVEEEEFE